MSIFLLNIIIVVLSYFFGSISSAIIICRLAGLDDPRTTGSNNPGATNVLRIGGKKYAILTLAGDVLKGLLPVLLAVHFNLADWVVASVVLGAFIGHLFPIFFGFKGGKGIATAFGVVFGVSSLLGVSVGLIWLIATGLFRYSSLSGLVAFSVAPFLAKFYFGYSNELFVALLLIAVFTLLRHHQNIKRLLSGTENKIGKSKASQ